MRWRIYVVKYVVMFVTVWSLRQSVMCLAETLVISVAVDSDHLGEMLYQVVFSVHLTCVVVHVDVLKERLLV